MRKNYLILIVLIIATLTMASCAANNDEYYNDDSDENMMEEESSTSDSDEKSASGNGMMKGIIFSAKDTLISVDPQTGDVTEVREFKPQDSEVILSTNASYTSYQALQDYNADLTKRLAHKKVAIPEHDALYGHIGWVDTNGEFEDLTEKLDSYNNNGDYLDAKPLNVNCGLNYRDRCLYMSGDGIDYRVPLSRMSPDALETYENDELGEYNVPTANVDAEGCVGYVRANWGTSGSEAQQGYYMFTESGQHEYVWPKETEEIEEESILMFRRAVRWTSKDSYVLLTSNGDYTMLYHCQRQSGNLFNCKAIIPYDENRKIISCAVSEDCKRVAIVSEASDRRDLYIADVDGSSTPEQVIINEDLLYDYNIDDAIDLMNCKILCWSDGNAHPQDVEVKHYLETPEYTYNKKQNSEYGYIGEGNYPIVGGEKTASNNDNDQLSLSDPYLNAEITYNSEDKDGEISKKIQSVKLDPSMFESNSALYQPDIAILAASLSAAAGDNPSEGLGDNIYNAYKRLGFKDEDIWLFSYPGHPNNKDYIKGMDDKDLAFSIASRQLPTSDNPLMIITLRGTVTLGDGIKDVMLVKQDFYGSKAHRGFYDFYQDCIVGMVYYFEEHPDISKAMKDGSLKILVTGHSMGGAAANLLGVHLNNTEDLEWENIYAYTFEAPNNHKGSLSDEYEDCANVINIVNKRDPIPKLPNFSWLGTWERFGNTLEFRDNEQYNSHDMQCCIDAINEGAFD